MHDTFRMAEVEGFEQFKDVVSDVKVGEFGIEGFELGVLGRASASATTAVCTKQLTLTYSVMIDGVLD